jgi:predicted nucleotidyltransferase
MKRDFESMENIDTIISTISSIKPVLRDQYNVKKIGIFGSYIRGEQTKSSDLDILVEFEKPISLFRFMDLEEYLEQILSKKIDLVSKKALKPRIGKHILEEVMNI